MSLEFDKITEDKRGKIIWLSSGLKKINIVEIRNGFARGGHYHNHETSHFLIHGKIEYREKDIDTGKEKIEIVLPHKEIKIPSRIAHLLIALEHSIFIESKVKFPFGQTIILKARKLWKCQKWFINYMK